MREINSKYVLFNDKKTAWIELSKSSGISLLKNNEKIEINDYLWYRNTY